MSVPPEIPGPPPLPHLGNSIFLAWPAIHTDLVFNQGLALPGMASFPLLETAEGRDVLRATFARQIGAARAAGLGALLETPTFKASPARAPEGYRDPARLADLNARAVELLLGLRAAHPDVPILVGGVIGPSGDAYAPSGEARADAAERVHAPQVEALAAAGADVIEAYTFTHASDAVGAVRAAVRTGVPVVVSFTVETDGRLPLGQTLDAAIDAVDTRTGAAPAYYMLNCAHPDHIAPTLRAGDGTGDGPDDRSPDRAGRLKGVVVNASRKSHAELGRATELDAGNPEELGAEIGAICRRNPGFRVIGGCCGTDARHLACMAAAVAAQDRALRP